MSDHGDGEEKPQSSRARRPNLKLLIPDSETIEQQRRTHFYGTSGVTSTNPNPFAGEGEGSHYHHRQEDQACTCTYPTKVTNSDQEEGAKVNEADDTEDISDLLHLYTNPNSTFTTPSTNGLLHQNFQFYRELFRHSELLANTLHNGQEQQLDSMSSSSNHNSNSHPETSPSHLQSHQNIHQNPKGKPKDDSFTFNPTTPSTTYSKPSYPNHPTSILSKGTTMSQTSPTIPLAEAELRIQLAVAETKLTQAAKEVDSFPRTLAFVVQALVQNYPNQHPSFNVHNYPNSIPNSSPSAIISPQQYEAEAQHHAHPPKRGAANAGRREMQLEQEVEVLRREIRHLRMKLKEKDAHEVNSDEGSGKMVRFDESNINGEVCSSFTKTNAGSKNEHKEDEGEREEEREIQEQRKRVKDSFKSLDELTLVSAPSSPTEIAAKKLQLERDNVGIRSLDELLGPEDDTPKNGTGKAEKAVLRNLAAEGELESEDRANAVVSEEHKRAMARFMSVPESKVLKTGFDASGTTQGGDYDLKNLADSDSDGARFKGYPTRPGFGSYDRTPMTIEIKSKGAYELFDSLQERGEAIRNQQDLVGRSKEPSFPLIFTHGFRFIPGEDDTNFIRTVHIGNLPQDIHLREVLTRVRGGDVVSAILMDTKSVTGNMSALVQFSHESDAEEYACFSELNPVSFGEDGEKKVAEITLLESSPTYPMRHKKATTLDDHKPTRCLAIQGFSSRFSVRRLEQNIACGNFSRADSLLDTYFDEGGILHLEFSNIAVAGSSLAILNSWTEFRGVVAVFEDDPCARPVEDLLLPAEPRKPLHPNGGFVENEDSLSDYGGDALQSEMVQSQRKRLAALSNQNVVIPTFGDSNFKSSSWANEVNEEFYSPPQSPAQDSRLSSAPDAKDNNIRSSNIDEKIGEQNGESTHRSEVGLEGSMYAPGRSDVQQRSVRSNSSSLLSPVVEEKRKRSGGSRDNISHSTETSLNSDSSFLISEATREVARERAERIKGHVNGRRTLDENFEGSKAGQGRDEVSVVHNPDELELELDLDSDSQAGDEENVSPNIPKIVIEEVLPAAIEA